MRWARCSDTSRPILSRGRRPLLFDDESNSPGHGRLTAGRLPHRFRGSEPMDRCLARSYGDRRRQQHVPPLPLASVVVWAVLLSPRKNTTASATGPCASLIVPSIVPWLNATALDTNDEPAHDKENRNDCGTSPAHHELSIKAAVG